MPLQRWQHFYMLLPNLTDPQKAWIESLLDRCDNTEQTCFAIAAGVEDPDKFWPTEEDRTMPMLGPVTALQQAMVQEGKVYHDLTYEFYPGRMPGTTNVAIRSEGDTPINIVLAIMVAFSAAFPDLAPLYLEWSEDGAPEDVDTYGGGAAVVWKGQLYYWDTGMFIDEIMGMLERRSNRIDNLPPGRCYLRHMTLTSADLEALTLDAGGTLRDAIEKKAEEHARAQLARHIGEAAVTHWDAQFTPIHWLLGMASIAVTLTSPYDDPVPPSEQEKLPYDTELAPNPTT